MSGLSPLEPSWRSGDVAVAVVGHAARGDGRRECLATLLDRPMSEIVLRASGAPGLASPPGAVYSVAHRRGVSLFGAAWGGEIGVDLEMIDPEIAAVEIADTFFSAVEAVWLGRLPAPLRALGFVAIWATKEAVLKSSGRGIVGGLETPVVEVAALTPLLAGAGYVAFELTGAAVELRCGSVDATPTIACVARRRS